MSDKKNKDYYTIYIGNKDTTIDYNKLSEDFEDYNNASLILGKYEKT